MQTHTPRPWAAIALGLMLVSAAASGPTGHVPQPQTRSGLAAEELRARLSCELRERNPRLSVATAARIASAVERCEQQHGVPADLVTAVLWVESSARPYAHSPMGALGLMQVMPHMYAELDLPGHPALIETNLEAGCMLLADNIRRWGHDDGISAYFWGTSIRGDRYLNKVRAARAEIAPRLDPAAERCG